MVPERGSISLSSTQSPQPLPPPPQQQQKNSVQLSAFSPLSGMLHLPILTATSLRPAKRSSTSHSTQQTSHDDSGEQRQQQQHPLLHQLLSDATTFATRQAPLAKDLEAGPPWLLPTLDDAVDEVGGADKMESLLRQLRSLSPQHAQQWQLEEAGSNTAFSSQIRDAVRQCVRHALNLSDDAVHVRAVQDDPSLLQVQIPLPVSAAIKKEKAVPGRPCLVLRMHRQRGVLSLHIIHLRFQAPDEGIAPRATRRRLPQSPLLKRKGSQSAATAADDHALIPPLLEAAMPCNNACAEKPASSLRLPDSGLGGFQLGAALCRPSGALDKPKAVLTDKLRVAPSRTPSASAARRTGVSRLAKGSRSSRKRHGSARRLQTESDAVEFDPLRPEETTPFNAQHRPLTFNAAIAFS
ncbi:hypothetical protein ABB37_04798 [Leptomonas pyrrhocoris]|uniref:Uncharacterized protein n=1 Tax=Leptomonas pyrrhocoris TaxID=157538 RepID=A0A0N1J4V4_LEPPY|nr:hypothetical protein ABB37_04798 [Leptomonas pyrrhocoris]XP_015659041.1 hypothetical protein ABB37_04798 [Leptomonas pyrrhocoris]KPA80601.1 hypothetical protein ABB37_04798 [Leptomonas pyrrhocoris]KPA80602.1 hypothetical protein ABB37_04798 [Leptomonas pyrrhocoris]|eukprot:XP_015659040.1 hypothetical protein ABB37_04798 [Leptomonas pyrrhocoris]